MTNPKTEIRNPKIAAPPATAPDAPAFTLPATGRHYDLLQRATEFSKHIVLFAKKMPRSVANDKIAGQLVDAGTSVGANYHEADDASSPRDYRHKVAICRKESKESMFWLHMAAVAEPPLRDEAAELWLEARALNRIFGKIIRTCDANTATRKILPTPRQRTTVPTPPQTPA